MIPASFEYEVAESADHAIELLGRFGEEAKLLAGGHSLLPLMKLRLAVPTALVDIGRVSELDYVRDGGDHIAIGAVTRHEDVHFNELLRRENPLVAHAAGEVGDPQVRHRGTIGGSISHGDPASDLPSVMVALDATFVVRGPGGQRSVGARDFFKSLFITDLGEQEILTEVRVPKLAGVGWSYQKFHTRARWPAPSTADTSPRCSPVALSRRHDRAEEEQDLPGGRLLMGAFPFESVEELQAVLGRHAYLADRGLATAIWLSLALSKPLLLEGEAGVGKTEVAKVLSELLDRRLVRLQCYEGIDASQALYEWDYSRQLIAVRAAQLGEREADLFGPDFLVERPLLAAIRAGSRAVLLIDELDRADDEFEAFLLEVLSEFAVTIPELGRVAAAQPPAVVITSNRTRELHDALKRRCLYHWIDHPTVEREVEIVRVRAPEVPEALARQVARAVARLRAMDVAKRPGVAETIDWSQALAFLGAERLEPQSVSATLGALVKDHEDLELVRSKLDEVLEAE